MKVVILNYIPQKPQNGKLKKGDYGGLYRFLKTLKYLPPLN